MQIQRPEVKILNNEGGVKGTLEADVPDLLTIQGTLKGREDEGAVLKGALLTHVFRNGTPFKGQPGLTWNINGSKGELLITMGEKFLFLEDYAVIQVHDHAKD